MELPNRAQLEAAFAAKLSRLNSRHRRELESLLGWPPDIGRVPPEFWRRVQREQEEELAAALLLLFVQSHDYHVRLAGGAADLLRAQSLAAAEEFARRQAREAAAATIERWRMGLAEVAAKEWQAKALDVTKTLTRQEVAGELLRKIGPQHAARTATTQTTAAQSAGGDHGINRTVGLSDDDVWRIHPELSMTGTCKICRPLDGRPRRIWSIDFPLGPPAHANCNCEIVYANAGAGTQVYA